MNLLHGNKFSPWEDFFVNPFGSVLTPYVSVHVCTGAGRSTCGGTMKLIRFHSGSFINLVFTSPNSGRYYVKCNYY